jgi:NADPH:quinone reductase-like Zn-dependent oxidoreductase
MKAIVQDRYGSPDVLQLREVDTPVVGDDEVLVRVRAAGVDQGVWHVMAGLPYLIRLAGYGIRAPKNPVPGADLAGGGGSRQGRDQVSAWRRGVRHRQRLVRRVRVRSRGQARAQPSNLSLEQAASVAISGLPALQGLRDHGRVRPGQKVLIIGASGGVGTYAVQLAKALEAEVTAVCSPAKVDMVSSIGADHVIDYRREDFAERKHHYDVILDVGGNSSLSRLRRALTPKGRLVITGGETDGRWLGDFDRQIRARLLSPFVGQTLTTFISLENYEDMIELKNFIEAGTVRPVIDRTFPLGEVPEAIRYLRDGRARGKVIITVWAAE